MSDQRARPGSTARSSENAATSDEGSAQLSPPLDPPMVPFALGGLAIWAVAGLAALASRNWLAEHGHRSWLGICLAGFIIGIVGLLSMVRHDAHRRVRRDGESAQRIHDESGHTPTG